MEGIQILFNWVLVSSAMASLMVFIILLIKSIFKNRLSATWHYYIWVLLLIRLMMPYAPENPYSVFNFLKLPLANTALSIRTDADVMENTWPDTIDEVDSEVVIPQIQPHQQNQTVYKGLHQMVAVHPASFYKNLDLKFTVVLVWIAGAALVALYIIYSNFKCLWKIRTCPSLSHSAIHQIFNECQSAMGVNGNIPILLSKSVSSPSLFGIVRPRLLLPYDIFEKLSDTDLKYIFLHELAHLKRKDLVINWITVFLKVLHWFNPFIWYGFYKMHQDCEVSCDALVLSGMKQEEHIEYGYTLIRLLKMTSKPRWIPGTTGFFTDKSLIKRRILMISLFKRKTWKWSAIGIVVTAIMTFFVLTNAKNSSAKPPATNTANAEQEAASLNSDKGTDGFNGIVALDIEGRDFNGKMLVIPDPKKIAVGFNLEDLEVTKTTSQIAKDNKAISAINAGGFRYEQSDGLDYKPSGIIIHEGKVIYDELKDENAKQDIVAFTEEGKLVVGKYTLTQLKEYKVKEAVSFGPPLIVNGNPMISKGDGGWGLAPRTAIGQKADGTVLFLVINGRSFKSIGATLLDVQEILLKQGAIMASNLDGGSSSTMYLNGKVINQPSDIKGERSVPSAFMVLP